MKGRQTEEHTHWLGLAWLLFWGWASEVAAPGPAATAETPWSTEAQPDWQRGSRCMKRGRPTGCNNGVDRKTAARRVKSDELSDPSCFQMLPRFDTCETALWLLLKAWIIEPSVEKGLGSLTHFYIRLCYNQFYETVVLSSARKSVKMRSTSMGTF